MTTTRTQLRAVFLDLDRNIFRTADLEKAILWILAVELGISPIKFAAEMKATTTDGEGYDLFDHLASRGFSPVAAKLMLFDHLLAPDFAESDTAEHIRTCRQQMFGEKSDPDPFTGSFLFEGATELLESCRRAPDTDLWIVTTGSHDYQLFKLELVRLAHLRHHILSSNKGEWFAELWFDGVIRMPDGTIYETALFADDKASAIVPLAAAPETVRLVHVIRPGAKYPKPTGLDRVEIVSHLTEIY